MHLPSGTGKQNRRHVQKAVLSPECKLLAASPAVAPKGAVQHPRIPWTAGWLSACTPKPEAISEMQKRPRISQGVQIGRLVPGETPGIVKPEIQTPSEIKSVEHLQSPSTPSGGGLQPKCGPVVRQPGVLSFRRQTATVVACFYIRRGVVGIDLCHPACQGIRIGVDFCQRIEPAFPCSLRTEIEHSMPGGKCRRKQEGGSVVPVKVFGGGLAMTAAGDERAAIPAESATVKL